MGRISVRSRILIGVYSAFIFASAAFLGLSMSYAAPVTGDFALQLSPSPIVASIKPGATSNIDLQIRNNGIHAEDLKIEPRQFKVDSKTGAVNIDDKLPPDIANWITFAQPKFTIQVGQTFTQHVSITVPKDSGFSYSFALLISRAEQPQAQAGTRAVAGAIADFTLINIDRPGASSEVDVTDFSTDQQIYEFLPANINLKLKNVGNTINKPTGNVFVFHGSTDKTPLFTAPVNDKEGYILPGTERTFTATWDDGFPVFKTTTTDDNVSSAGLDINWDNLSHFRFGQFTARLVVVYNDGKRDVPVERDLSFWVIPYKTIAGIVIALIILIIIRRRMVERKTEKAVKRAIAKRDKQPKKSS